MKSKLKLGLIIVSALISSASFGVVVGQILKDREAESAFQSLSEQFSEPEPKTDVDETKAPETLILEEKTKILALNEEDPFPLPIVKKPNKSVSKTQPVQTEESATFAPEETTADSPALEVTEPETAPSTTVAVISQPTSEAATVPTTAASPWYKGIQNCVGWLRIDGTAINYPVMQSKDDPEFYLHHAVSDEYSYPGVPFLDARCELGVSNQLIIYGHNMKNGTMFHNLRNYSSYSYWQNHRFINLDTVNGSVRYEVMAVIQYDSDHDPFRFNAYTEMDSDTFVWFIQQVRARQIYETGVTASFGDELLTLSTCDWTYTNGRLLVIARRIPS